VTLNETLSTALGAFALAVSLVTLRYARTDRAADDDAKQRDAERGFRTQLTSVLADLNQLQLENAKLWSRDPGPARPSVLGQSAILNQQNALLTRQAVDLVGRIPHMVSGVEYAMLATALAHLGDLGPADRYWSQAVKRTTEPYFAAIARRGYAGFLFATGDVERGRDQFDQALEVLSGDGDYNAYTAGVTHLMWASGEADARALDRARQQLAEAGRAFSSIDALGLRARADADLAAARDALGAAEAAGAWTLRPSAPPAASRSSGG
jgi:tetratricopeptide (TPR) repeat protein